jgi:hypothetical protein
VDPVGASPTGRAEGAGHWQVSCYALVTSTQGFLDCELVMCCANAGLSMNGEVRIWDVRAPDSPLYEKVAQKDGLMALTVHLGAPVFAT